MLHGIVRVLNAIGKLGQNPFGIAVFALSAVAVGSVATIIWIIWIIVGSSAVKGAAAILS